GALPRRRGSRGQCSRGRLRPRAGGGGTAGQPGPGRHECAPAPAALLWPAGAAAGRAPRPGGQRCPLRSRAVGCYYPGQLHLPAGRAGRAASVASRVKSSYVAAEASAFPQG
nr:hypothetical protein [Tanacetum cinerariifolium]